MKFDLVMGNPPYHEKNVKIGGGLFIKFLEKTIPMASKICMIVPNTFMFRRDCESIRQQLIQNGMKEIYHLPSNTFGANVKTCVIYLDKSYKEDSFVQSDNGIQLQFPIEKYLSGDTIPYTLDENDRQFFEQISSLSSSRRIKGGSEESSRHRVVWEYLIGLDENRFQREVIVRKIRHEPPGILTRNQCYVEVDSKEQAMSLVAFLEEHAHRFVKMIPRGSSVEGWMMQPLIGFAERCGVLTDYSIDYIKEQIR